MIPLAVEISLIFLLLLANGAFAMAEIAVVSARKPRLRQLAERGDPRARIALELAESPNAFLATVQIGITWVGVIAAAFSGATLAEKLAATLTGVEWLAPHADELAFVVVVLVLTYCTLVVGELVPKRLGLGNPERVACAVAGPMRRLSRIGAPIVSLLGWSTDALLRLFRIAPAPEISISEEEVKLLMREGSRVGVFHPSEPAMIERVMALDRLPVRSLMTPRAQIVWLDVRDSRDEIWRKITASGHSTFPVVREQRDRVVGVVTVKSIYEGFAASASAVDLKELVTPALVVPGSLSVAGLLEKFKQVEPSVALVADEYGGIVGLVSLHDVMEAIVGELPSTDDRARPRAVRREDGSWLVDGMLDARELATTVFGFDRQQAGIRDQETAGGFVVSRMGHVPREGETIEIDGYLVEIIDMDHQRVDKILFTPQAQSARPAER